MRTETCLCVSATPAGQKKKLPYLQASTVNIYANVYGVYNTLKMFYHLELEAALLKELDPQLYTHLVTDGMESFAFCHRYLIEYFLIFILCGHIKRTHWSCDRICCPSLKMAPAGFPKGVWAPRCVAFVRDPELWPPGAYFSKSRKSPISRKAGAEMEHR